MKRKIGYYWTKGYTWSETKVWFISWWDGHYFWSDGDDVSEGGFVKIDERQIKRNEK